MKKTHGSSTAEVGAGGADQIALYSEAQALPFRAICNALRGLIEKALPGATSKIWHGSPVWFAGENPVVGYNATKKTVNLLFWNGQALDEPAFKPVGKHGAAQALFTDTAEIDPGMVRRWMEKAGANVLDWRAYIKELRESSRAAGST